MGSSHRKFFSSPGRSHIERKIFLERLSRKHGIFWLSFFFGRSSEIAVTTAFFLSVRNFVPWKFFSKLPLRSPIFWHGSTGTWKKKKKSKNLAKSKKCMVKTQKMKSKKCMGKIKNLAKSKKCMGKNKKKTKSKKCMGKFRKKTKSKKPFLTPKKKQVKLPGSRHFRSSDRKKSRKKLSQIAVFTA